MPTTKRTAKQTKVMKALAEAADAIVETPTPRQQILDEASEIVHKDRNSAYGMPEDNFRNIAALWSAYLQATFPMVSITSQDVPLMMILVKTARLATNQNHWDSNVDIAGYSACLGDIQHRHLHPFPQQATERTSSHTK